MEVTRFKYCAACRTTPEERKAYYYAHREAKLVKTRERYYRLKSEGLCVKCGQDVAISETLCFGCLSKKDEHELSRLRIP